MHSSIRRVSQRSCGQFNPKNWFDEGDGLLSSAKRTRDTWTDHRQVFSETKRSGESKTRDRLLDWNLLTGLPRASMLLLGYSVEMYLKGGIIKAYRGCSEQMFERDIKCKFRHKFVSMANEICFPLGQEDETNLMQLQNMVLVDARYPIFVPEGESYSDTKNQQTRKIWSSHNFELLISLANRIREHSKSLDVDSHNPAFFMYFRIDNDGYLAFRIGGGLPPRITYRLSSEQKQSGQTSMDDVKSLFSSSESRKVFSYWDRAWIYEDREKKTSCRARPSH